MATKKKNNKTASQIAIEIQENQKIYEEALRDALKLGEINKKRYSDAQQKVIAEYEGSNKNIVQKLGNVLQRGLLKNTPQKISTRLSRDLKPIMGSTTARKYCNDEWKMQTQKRDRSYKLNTKTVAKSEPLTQQEQQFVQAHEEEYVRNQQMSQLIFSWTDKSNADIGSIIKRTPKGMHWARKLFEESRDHIITKIKQMTDSDVAKTSEDLRVAKILFDGIGDLCYDEHELRQKKSEMLGK